MAFDGCHAVSTLGWLATEQPQRDSDVTAGDSTRMARACWPNLKSRLDLRWSQLPRLDSNQQPVGYGKVSLPQATRRCQSWLQKRSLTW